MLRAQFAQGLEEPGLGQDQVHVSRHRLDDDAGDLCALRCKQRLDLVAVVVVQDERVLCDVFGHAGGTGIAERERTGPSLDQQAVGMAVVAAFELHDLGAPGIAACEPDRGHRCLGPRRHQPHHFDRWHERAEQLRELDLRLGRCAEGQRARCSGLHRLDDCGVGMPEDHRPPRADIVDIALAVGVPQVGAGGTLEKERGAADRTECAHRGVDARGNALLGAQKKFFVAVAHAGLFSKRD